MLARGVQSRSVWKRAVKKWRLFLFLLIPFAYIILFCYVPMLGAQIAFRKYTVRGGFWGSEFVGLYQFRKFFKSYQCARVIGNTLKLSLYSIAAGFPIPILLALMFNCVRERWLRRFAQNVTYMPHFISVVVMVGIIYQVMNVRTGVLMQAYKALTGATDAPNLILSANAFPHLYTWSGIWQDMGWGTVIYTAALSTVDQTLHGAAVIDGASRFQRVWHIDFPAILPTISITLILRFGSIMNIGFDKVYLLQNTSNLRASEVIATYVYKVGLTGTGMDFSYSTAIGLFNSLVGLIMLSLINFLARRIGNTSLW